MKKNPFKEAAGKTTGLIQFFRPGIQAIKEADRAKFRIPDTWSLNGSIDIDTACKHEDPLSDRWDYCIGYLNLAYFIEVHPASPGEVQKMIQKLNWLKKWLKEKAPALDAIKAAHPYHWVHTAAGSTILPTSREYKLASTHGIVPKREFAL